MLINKKSLLTLFSTGLAAMAFSVSAHAAGQADNDVKPNDNQTLGYIGQDGQKYNGDGTKSSSDSVQGKSDAHFRVMKGYLTLNTVPSFGFGSIADSDTGQKLNDITDNDAILQSDSHYNQGTQPTSLSVTDSRYDDPTQDTAGKTPSDGYNVTAQMGQFSKVQSNKQVSDIEKGFNLNLSNNKSVTSKEDAKSTIKTNENINLGDDNSPQAVLSAKSIGSGTTTVNFNKGTLSVPAKVDPGTYAAQITWTLSPSSDDTNSAYN